MVKNKAKSNKKTVEIDIKELDELIEEGKRALFA